MGYKRSFGNRVRKVLRNEIETKRIVQTKQHCRVFGNAQSRQQLFGSGVNGPANTAGAETDYCWSLGHNRFEVWPVCMLFSERGLGAGYEVQTTENAEQGDAYLNQFKIRVGSDLYIKGISLKMMWSLERYVPFANLDIMLVRSKKGDCPRDDTQPGVFNSTNNDSNFYMGYSQNKELDMVNTRRHTIMKTWTRRFYQNVSTTIGGGEVAGGIVVHKKGTAALPEAVKVMQDPDGKTISEWIIKFYEEGLLDDYYILNRGSIGSWMGAGSSTKQDVLTHAGANTSYTTLLDDDNHLSAANQVETMDAATLENRYHGITAFTIYQGSDLYSPSIEQILTASGSQYIHSIPQIGETDREVQQVILVKKELAGLALDQVQMEHSKVIDLWIPGSYFGRGGNITYDAKGNSDELAGDYEYNLLFKTYANTKTWKWAGVGGDQPIMLKLADFQQIMYCKDL